jgi:hypothetical protein
MGSVKSAAKITKKVQVWDLFLGLFVDEFQELCIIRLYLARKVRHHTAFFVEQKLVEIPQQICIEHPIF